MSNDNSNTSKKQDGATNSVPAVANAAPANVAPATPTPAVPDTNAQLAHLLALLLKREEQSLQDNAAKQAAMEARSRQRIKSAVDRDAKILLKQARCRHSKGGKAGPRPGVVDYNVFTHTFINGETVIKCASCGAKWKQQDTVDFLIRSGRQIANHTKIGWAQALNMVQNSTNRSSSSEVPMTAKPVAVTSGVTDVEGVENFQM